MKKKEFYLEVYNVVSQIPWGKVLTYGHIAKLVGKPNSARMVGQAMFNAPEVLSLPSHRVVNSQGRIAPNWSGQKELLLSERVIFKTNECVDLKCSLWSEAVSL